MDEKDQKSLTINNILDQLTKPSILKDPEAPVARPNIPPLSPSIHIPTSKNEPAGDIKLPQLGGSETKIKSDSTQSTISSPQELKLSIRTMTTDLERLKHGQKPSTVDYQKVLSPKQPQSIPPLPIPSPPILPSKPLPHPIPRPAPQQFPRPKSQLSKPPTPFPTRSSSGKSNQPQRESEHFHPEKIISSKNNELPAFLGAPVPKKQDSKVPEEKLEYGLLAKVIGSGMMTGIVSTIVVATAAYFIITFFIFKGIEEDIITAPPPSPIGTYVPPNTSNELENIFKNIPIIDFHLPLNREVTSSNLKSFIHSQVMAQKEFKRLRFMDTTNQNITFTNILHDLSINYPVELDDYLYNSHMTFIYGQDGLIYSPNNPDQIELNRIIFIVEINNADKVSAIMQKWESTMPNDLKIVFGLNPLQKASQEFINNKRENINIRYMNFPLPTKSIDHAIVKSLTGRNYLIISNSRESIFSPIDKISGRQ